ncbi:MAG: hypothetical protein KDJ28_07050 [Candidatus Competibacteraceae bacterium]|nr:hypothetical protein [Candidatus Competibacteraceae bacterium]
MSHEPQKPPVADPLTLVLTGQRMTAAKWEATLRQHSNEELQRLARESMIEPANALSLWADCAKVAFKRYNAENSQTSVQGALIGEV